MPFKIARSILFLALTLALTAACSDDGQSTPADSGASDSAPKDGKAADDTGTQVDGLKTDSALVDMAALDGPLVDKGSVDSGGQDSAQKDGATADLVKSDMPAVDSGPAADSGPAWDGAAPAKKPNWVKILGNRGGATITSVAAHPSGGVAVLGLFHGQVNLGGGALISKG